MNVQLLLFVIAVLLVVVFWELCKINSHLKKTFPTTARTPVKGEVNDNAPAKSLD
jgi:hypothetical protein